MEAKLLEVFLNLYKTLKSEIKKVIVGQDEIINNVLISFFAGGHVLLEGVPGLGKTLLVKTMAQALNLNFSRIQFTPDLMPADIIGTTIIAEDEKGNREFRFKKGPVFGNIILADEINRATPKTQSALLEAMQEATVTIGGATHILPKPFFVMATQNPIGMEGTYPLPEAQLDRFFFKINVQFPSLNELIEIADLTTTSVIPKANPVQMAEKVPQLQNFLKDVPIAGYITEYASKIILATHPEAKLSPPAVKKYVSFGSSPRGLQALILAAKVKAVASGRPAVSVEDIQYVAKPVLRHRIILSFEGEAEEITTDSIIDEVLASCTKKLKPY